MQSEQLEIHALQVNLIWLCIDMERLASWKFDWIISKQLIICEQVPKYTTSVKCIEWNYKQKKNINLMELR